MTGCVTRLVGTLAGPGNSKCTSRQEALVADGSCKASGPTGRNTPKLHVDRRDNSIGSTMLDVVLRRQSLFIDYQQYSGNSQQLRLSPD